MVDTPRTIAALQTLLPDNTTRAISPQDARDMLVSVQIKYGEIFISTSAATSITNTTDFFEVAGTYTLGQNELFDMNTNGQLRYTGTPSIEVFVFGTLSLTVAGNNQLIHIQLQKNEASIGGADADSFISTGADVGVVSIVGVTGMDTNDHVEIAVRNETSTANITGAEGHVVAIGVAK